MESPADPLRQQVPPGTRPTGFLGPGKAVLEGSMHQLGAMPGGFAGDWEPEMLVFQTEGVNYAPTSSGCSTDVSNPALLKYLAEGNSSFPSAFL